MITKNFVTKQFIHSIENIQIISNEYLLLAEIRHFADRTEGLAHVIIPNVVMPNVVMPNVVMPDVVMPDVVMPLVILVIVKQTDSLD